MPTNPITIIDADLRPAGGYIDTIHVWYELSGGSLSQSDMCGHDFFLRWMPAPIQQKFHTISGYWHTIHPYERNAHLAEYLLDRCPVIAQSLN